MPPSIYTLLKFWELNNAALDCGNKVRIQLNNQATFAEIESENVKII